MPTESVTSSDQTSEREAAVYPEVVATRPGLDLIEASEAVCLAGLFRERCRRSGEAIAYRDYDHQAGVWRDFSWNQILYEACRWQTALKKTGLVHGDRVAIRVRNCRHWVAFDQAALGLGLVVVPLYVSDRADNVGYVIDHSESRLVFVENEEMVDECLSGEGDRSSVQKIIVLEEIDQTRGWSKSVSVLQDWLLEAGTDPAGTEFQIENQDPGKLASIVYTSGTTGRPKGVMLSHHNMLSVCWFGLQGVEVLPTDVFLSFLPLSHTLERTVGYYTPLMAGARVVYARSIPDLPEDLIEQKPTALISVPRIYERVYSRMMESLETSDLRQKLFNLAVSVGWERFEHQQGRKPLTLKAKLLWPVLNRLVAAKLADRLGGRLRCAISGGAPLPAAVGKTFCALGIPVLQGYGLTESSPSLTINTMTSNIPWSIGLPLHGVKLKLADDGELLARGDSIMMGYWKDEAATREVIDEQGWLHTGDIARIENGYLYITGRIKDIIVLSNGEKLPPADMETAIARDALFEQILVIGEQRPFLSIIIVLNPEMWKVVAEKLSVDADDPASLQSKEVKEALLARVSPQIANFPGYARIYQLTATLEPWSIENGLTTPTLKVKRNEVMKKFEREIEAMYAGH